MLCLQRGSAGVLVGPVPEADLVVVGDDLLDLEALGPGIDETLPGALEVVLDVALAAYVGAHFRGRGLLVHVVVLDAQRSLVDAHAFDERRAGDSQCERLAVVAVDAGDGMAHQLRRLLVRHRVDLVEALDDVAVARLLVREIHRRMAVHARAGLLDDHLALREPLVLEHVVVAALLAEIFRERVALPHRLEAGVLFDLRARHDRARVGLGRCLRHGLAAAVLGALHVDRFLVGLVVLRKRLAPFGRIVDVVAEGRAAQLSLAGGVRCSGLRCAGGRNEQEDRRERSHAGARKRSRVAQPAGRCRVSEGLGRNLSLCHGPSRSPKTREYRAGRHRRLLHLRALLNARPGRRGGAIRSAVEHAAIEYAKRQAASGSLPMTRNLPLAVARRTAEVPVHLSGLGLAARRVTQPC